MAQWIKKVGTTPVRGNGFIIDSFATNDNKKFNAPSLEAVLDRTDNNLLFGGLICEDNTGWKISAGGASTGAGYFAGPYGANFTPGFTGSLQSSPFSGSVVQEEQEDIPISITIAYAIYQGNPAGNPISYAYLDNLTFGQLLDGTPRMIDSEGIEVKLGVYLKYNLNINIKNAGVKSLQIMAVKVERGSVHTPISWISKDVGSQYLHSISQKMFKVKTFNFTGLSVAGIGSSITEDVEVTNYHPVGVIGYSASAGISVRECRVSTNIASYSKVYAFLDSLSGQALSNASLMVIVLYVSDEMYSTLVDTTVGP